MLIKQVLYQSWLNFLRVGRCASGLLQATVFRHFLDFLGLRGTSWHFISENHKLAIVKKIR